MNGFAAEVPASALADLARAAGVRWVSLDAPLGNRAGPDGTVNTAALLYLQPKEIRADKL